MTVPAAQAYPNALTAGTVIAGYRVVDVVVADARYCLPLPDGANAAALAPLLCAGLIGWRSYRMAGEGAAPLPTSCARLRCGRGDASTPSPGRATRPPISVANLTRADAREFLAIAPKAGIKTEVVGYLLAQANEALADLREGRLQGAAVLIP